MEKLDYKKAYKELYLPKTTPSLIEVPEMIFFMVDGKGDPNTSAAYKEALELLYAASFTIKMSKMGGNQPAGYFDYVVPPLEGLWWSEESNTDFWENTLDKSQFCWTSMIRQPEFVTLEAAEWVKEQLRKKKPQLDVSKLRYETYKEGLCAQIMHQGPYDNEPASIEKLNQFIRTSGYSEDFNTQRFHHEIYLGDPRKTKPENLRTVIRHPIK